MMVALAEPHELPPIPAKRYFTIGEVSDLCGVKPHVLRYWEQEFTQLKPVKRRGNRRYYQHHEVLLIRRIRDMLYEQGFTHLHSATPGPIGLAALGISRILKLPIYGTYHTAFPQYAKVLTGDDAMEELMWKYMLWYYNQMDKVFVPSRATGPRKPLSEPVKSSASAMGCRSTAPRAFLTLTGFISWSPRRTTATASRLVSWPAAPAPAATSTSSQ